MSSPAAGKRKSFSNTRGPRHMLDLDHMLWCADVADRRTLAKIEGDLAQHHRKLDS